ncbi:MAG: Fe-S protein assembly co-chaperone HscB [Saprospiraceae bacterium]
MNYFEFFDLPVAFIIDEALLKQRFYANSKKYHPDFYTLESAEKQAAILELSTLNNQAYRTLADFDKRMEYILNLKGVLAEEGKNEIPQDFLLEMMDINEGLMELEFDFDETKHQEVLQAVENQERAIYAAAANVIEQYDDKKIATQELSVVKEYFLKKKYLLRIRENVSKFATQ